MQHITFISLGYMLDKIGRRQGWDDLREQHRNMYIIKCETDLQPRLDA